MQKANKTVHLLRLSLARAEGSQSTVAIFVRVLGFPPRAFGGAEEANSVESKQGVGAGSLCVYGACNE